MISDFILIAQLSAVPVPVLNFPAYSINTPGTAPKRTEAKKYRSAIISVGSLSIVSRPFLLVCAESTENIIPLQVINAFRF
jgi:hypothetical protein